MNLHTAPAAGATPAADRAAGAPAPIGEFLAFTLGAEEFGIDILRVQEIRSYERPTRIANAPEFFKGVVNLRGVIVPIIDLRLKLRLAQASYDDLTVVIVLQIGCRLMGLVVDAVSDVITLDADQLRASAEPISPLRGEHLLAVCEVNDRPLALLDIDKLMSGAEMGLAAPTPQ